MPRYFWLASLRSRSARRTDRSRVLNRRSSRPTLELLEARDVPALTLAITPDPVAHGATATGTLTRDGDLSAALTVALASSDANELSVPTSVTLTPGQSQATFPAVAAVNLVSEAVTVTATAQVTQGSSFGLDPTFGTGGLATTSLSMSIQPPHAATAVQADGKILAASEYSGTSWQLTRLNPDGSLDTSFGTNGVIVTAFTDPNRNRPVPHTITIQGDGKILVGGSYGGYSTTQLALLARYNANGTPDTGFGSGGTAGLTPLTNDSVESIAVRPDGRVLLGLQENGSVFTRVAQLTPTGAFDQSFGNSGVASLSLGYSAEWVALLPDGRFIAAGSFQSKAAVARVQANGQVLDGTFGANGVAQLNFGTGGVSSAGVAFDSHGRIVYAADVYGLTGGNSLPADFAVGRLNPDGTADVTFGTGGKAVLDVSGVGAGDVVTTVAVQPDDKIVLGGWTDLSTGRDSALARFNADGTPDATFGTGGAFHQSLVTTYTADTVFSVALQPDGRLVALTGWATDIRAARFNTGVQTITLTASDTVTVADGGGTNHAPVATDRTATLAEDTTLTGAVTATDADGDPLTYAAVTGPAHGVLSFNPDGTFTYTPNPDYNGPDSFTFKANDGLVDSNVATVAMTVTPVNDLPVAQPLTATTNEDTSLPGRVVATDPDSQTLTYAVVTGPAHGTLTLNTTGTFVYTPAANYNGTDTFTFKANDGQLDSNTATVAITITPVNDPPTAQPLAVATAEDTPVSGQVTATDPDSSTLTYATVTGPAHGALSFNPDGTFTYTPAANYNGSDSFTFRANDGQASGNTATVSITVTPVNDPPVAVDDAYTTAEDTPLVVGVPTGQGTTSLTMVSAPGDYIGQGKTYGFGPASGTFTMANPYPSNPAYANVVEVRFSNATEWWTLDFAAPQNARFVPGMTYTGATRFPFQSSTQPGLSVSGDGRGSNTLTGQFTVAEAVYDAAGNLIRFGADFVQHSEGLAPTLTGSVRYNYLPPGPLGVLGNDTDPDADALSAVLVTGPQHGSVALNPDGTFTYTPAANYNGTDTFAYKANDGKVDSNTATVSITVTPVNDPPVAQSLGVTTAEDTPVSGQVSATDVDSPTLTYAVVSGPAHGTLAFNPDGTFAYTPGANYNGSDSFTFQANDGQASSNVATVNITVTPVNDPPVAQPLTATTAEDTPLVGQVTATDVDGDPLTFATVAGPQNGTLTLNPDGTFTYTPGPDFNGSDSFTFQANDGQAVSNTATVSITVTPVNDPPVAQSLGVTTAEDTPVSGQVSATDVDSPTLTYVAVTSPAHGTLTLNANGTFTYTPGANYNGTDSFTFQANDGQAGSNVATVNITVTPVNDPPVAQPLTATTAEDTPLVGQVTATDVDGDLLTYTVVTSPAHGTLVLNPGGAFTYTPNANYNGSDAFTYKTSDGQASSAASVSITVTPVNDPPVAQPLTATTAEDTPLTGRVTATDPDSSTLTYALVSGPAHGTLTLNANGTFTYTPSANYNGSDTFSFRASDGQAVGSTATVSITVTPVNDPPVAQPLSVTATSGSPLSGQVTATDPDSSTLTYALVTSPKHGTLQFRSDGTFTYTPAKNYTGTDSFTFRANDGQANSNVATVSISVARPVNHAPTLAPTTFSVQKNASNGTTVGTVAGADVDGDSLTYSILSGNTSNAFTIDSKTGRVTVASRSALSGRPSSFSLTVQVRDPDGLTATATIRINVT